MTTKKPLNEAEEFERRRNEANTFRVMAFSAVAFSTMATLICAITLPMLYSYIYRLQTNMYDDVDFCKARSHNMWREISRTQVNFYGKHKNLRF